VSFYITPLQDSIILEHPLILSKYISLLNKKKSVFPSTSSFSLNPMKSYLFFACSISMRSVAWGALPCMCLKYKKSSPLWAIDLSSGRRAIIWLYFSGTLG